MYGLSEEKNDVKSGSPASGFVTSTENYFIYEHVTTMNPWEIQMSDEISEPETIINSGIFSVICGIGGILVFLVVFSICTFCFHYLRDVSESEERETRRLREAFAPSNIHLRRDENVTAEDFQERSNQSTIPKQVIESCQVVNRNPENHERAERGARSLRDMPISFRSLLQSEERIFFPEDFQDMLCQNTIPKQVADSCHVINRKHENRGRAEREQLDATWLTESSLCFRSPPQSEDRLFFPEDFQDLLSPNAAPKDVLKACKEIDKKLSEQENGKDASSEIASRQPCHSLERQSRSSPTSPDIIRRRFNSFEGKPRRPSSWR